MAQDAATLAKLETERDALIKANKWKEALPLAETIVNLREKSSGSSALALAQARLALGRCYAGTGLQDKADTQYLQSLDAFPPNSLDRANALSGRGLVAFNRSKLEEAQKLFEEAVAIQNKIVPNTQEVASSLMLLGLIARNRGKIEEAINFAEQEIQIEKKINDTSESLAAAYGTLGELYYLQNALDKANTNIKKSLEIGMKIAPDSPSVSTALNNLGTVALASERLDEAQVYFEKSLLISKKVESGTLNYASSLFNVGIVAWQRGRLNEAEEYFEQAYALYKKLAPNFSTTFQVLHGLGAIAQDRGYLEKAQDYYLQVLTAFNKEYPGKQPPVDTLNNLGNIAMLRGHFKEAQHLYEETLAILEKEQKASTGLSMALDNLGTSLVAQNRLTEAKQYIVRGLKVHQQLSPRSLGVATSLVNLGAIATMQHRWDEARQYLTESLTLREQLSPQSVAMASSLHSLGDLYREQGNINEARKYYQRTLTLQRSLAPESLDVATILAELGNLAQRQRRLTEAQQLHDQLLSTLEALQGREGLASASDFVVLTDATASALRWIPTRTLAPATYYSWIPTLRGVSLTLQSRALAAQHQAEQDSVIAKLIADVQSATKLETDWITQKNKPVSPAEREKKLREFRLQRQRKTSELVKALKAKDSRLGNNLKVSTAQVQAGLAPGQILVEFLRSYGWNTKEHKPSEDEYGAFIVPKTGKVRYVRLGKAELIDDNVQEFMECIARQDSTQRLLALAKQLYNQLIKPLGPMPNDVLIAPDGSLYQLAFNALIDANGKYLVETKNISHVGSGRDLIRTTPTRKTNRPLVLAGPAFDADAKTIAKNLPQNIKPLAVALDRDSKATQWQPLPGALREGQAVAKALGVIPFTGPAAVAERLFQTVSPLVLHLATHGFFYPAPTRTDSLPLTTMGDRLKVADNPMLRSGLVFAGANQETQLKQLGLLSGWTTALELSQLDLRGTELVVLSACNTGRGDVRLGEGVFGLQRAFRFAGAKTLIMSLFSVPDESSRALFETFYKTWKPGMTSGSKLRALRKAQILLLKSPRTRHPKNWAGFVLLGDR